MLNDVGSIIAATGDINRGVQLLEEAHNLAPDNTNIGYNYARGLYQQGKIDEAVMQTSEVLKRKPDLDEARLLRASAAIQKGHYRAAEEELSKLGRGKEVPALLILGVVQIAQGKSRDGLATFEQAIRNAPQNQMALYNAGVAAQQNNDLAQAANYYKRAIFLDHSLAEAHNNLGTVLMRTGNPQAAFDEFHTAVLQKADDNMKRNLKEAGNGLGQSLDKITGEWVSEGGIVEVSGTANGQLISKSMPIPTGGRIKLTKTGEGMVRLDESISVAGACAEAETMSRVGSAKRINFIIRMR